MPKVYFVRGLQGLAVKASWDRSKIEAQGRKSRYVETHRELVAAMLGPDGIDNLFDAAWRMAVRDGAIKPGQRLQRVPSHFDLESALVDAETMDGYICDLVNNPKSKFYIYG